MQENTHSFIQPQGPHSEPIHFYFRLNSNTSGQVVSQCTANQRKQLEIGETENYCIESRRPNRRDENTIEKSNSKISESKVNFKKH